MSPFPLKRTELPLSLSTDKRQPHYRHVLCLEPILKTIQEYRFSSRLLSVYSYQHICESFGTFIGTLKRNAQKERAPKNVPKNAPFPPGIVLPAAYMAGLSISACVYFGICLVSAFARVLSRPRCSDSFIQAFSCHMRVFARLPAFCTSERPGTRPRTRKEGARMHPLQLRFFPRISRSNLKSYDQQHISGCYQYSILDAFARSGGFIIL